MKKITILLLMIFSIIGCEKDNPAKPSEPIAEIDKLPPATQIGAKRIGCLLDGKAFMPGYYNNSRNCFYQKINGEYHFAIGFNNKDTNFNLTSISLVSRKKAIFQGETYQLYEAIDGNIYGCYIYNVADPVYTTQIHTGELKITKLDPVKHIVSGTFWFDVEDKNGVIHQIREGRFDMRYTN
ncbi:MAG: hypothetical protein ACI7YS_01030 [Flavobacterium sp.]